MQIANQGDNPMLDTPPPSGFLKAIFPCLRKGSGGGQGSMAWVKLVDDEGRVAGHAVLSARISMAMLGGTVRRHQAKPGRVVGRGALMAVAAVCSMAVGGHAHAPCVPRPA